MAQMKAILVPVDGSENSDRAVKHALGLVEAGLAVDLHLLNVQPSFGGTISTFVGRDQIDSYRRDEGNKCLASGVALARAASVQPKVHIGVGRQGEVVRDYARKLGADVIVMGTRGHTGLSGVLLGSVAQDVIAHSDVPVALVK